MDLEKDYRELYDHWHQEYLKAKLTSLNQQKVSRYKQLKQKIEKTGVEDSDPILKNKILQTYKENISFLVKDLLKMREIKIINTALSLEEIEKNLLTEPEKLFYKNLVRSVKGFKKLKAMQDTGMELDVTGEDFDVQLESKEIPRVAKSQESSVEKDISSEGGEEQEIEIERAPKTSLAKKGVSQCEKEEMEYTIVRFLKDCPAIMGADLIKYAPFKKEDLASLPSINAKILISEKFAEEINIEK
ncbi:MAG: hypothetical protein ACOC4M_15485 [Promethearchaeia archaeon]